MIYAAFILLTAAVVICHLRDWKENKLTGRINHSKAWKWKAIYSIPAVILFLINLSGWPVRFDRLLAMACTKSVGLTAIWFLFLFNALWGYRAAKDIFYRSTAVGKDLPRTDKIFLHWPKAVYILFIVALVAGATIFYLW